MTWWMILLLIFAVLFLIGCIPVGVSALYREEQLTVKLKIGLLRLQVLPGKEKPAKKPKKPKKKQEKPKNPQPKTAGAGEKKKGSNLLPNGLWSVLDYLQLLSDTLGNLRRKLRLEVLTLHATFGGDDPAKAAMSYGRAWAAVGALEPWLDRLFVIKKRDIRPILDYNVEKQTIDGQLTLTITIGRALALGIRAGFGFLKIFKGGANT